MASVGSVPPAPGISTGVAKPGAAPAAAAVCDPAVTRATGMRIARLAAVVTIRNFKDAVVIVSPRLRQKCPSSEGSPQSLRNLQAGPLQHADEVARQLVEDFDRPAV